MAELKSYRQASNNSEYARNGLYFNFVLLLYNPKELSKNITWP